MHSLTYLICDKDVELQQPFSPLGWVNPDPLSLPDGGGLEGVARREVDKQLDAKLVNFVDDRYLRDSAVDTHLHVPMDCDQLAERLQLQLLKSWTDVLCCEPKNIHVYIQLLTS